MIFSFHDEYLEDEKELRSVMTRSEYEEFVDVTEREFNTLSKQYFAHTQPCEYEPLASANCRKNKFHSTVIQVGKANMRMVCQYKEKTNTIFMWSIGYRWSEDNPYKKASRRLATT